MNNLLILPEPVYFICLLCSWIAATFTGIAFVYSVHMRKVKRTISIWGGIFAVCLVMVFLLMNGIIVTDTMMG